VAEAGFPALSLGGGLLALLLIPVLIGSRRSALSRPTNWRPSAGPAPSAMTGIEPACSAWEPGRSTWYGAWPARRGEPGCPGV